MKSTHNGIIIEGTPQEILEYRRLSGEKNKSLAQKNPQEINDYMDRIYGRRSLHPECQSDSSTSSPFRNTTTLLAKVVHRSTAYAD